MLLCLVMLCSIMSISAFASEAEPSVTVYITTGMFTEGTPSDPQHYQSGVNPAAHPLNNSHTWAQTVTLSNVNKALTTTQGIYHGVAGRMEVPNLLDAIIVALHQAGIQYVDITGGWDDYDPSQPGGYINGFTPGGEPKVNETKTETIDDITYRVYSGTGWQIAYGTAVSNIEAIDLYGTNYGLEDGMIIVFDLSPYAFYYEA